MKHLPTDFTENPLLAIYKLLQQQSREIAEIPERLDALTVGNTIDKDPLEAGTIKDAVRWMDGTLAENTIQQLAKKEQFPCHYTGTGRRYYKKSEVEAYKRNRFER